MSAQNSIFVSEVSARIWDSKYRYRDNETLLDARVQDSWRRVARSLAGVEGAQATQWTEQFYQLLNDFTFLPGGRILAGAGTGHDVTLFNCFVMGLVGDSMDAIFDALKEGALTMQQGGGVGYDFSTLRPKGFAAHRSGTIASGPVSFMHIWNAMCATLLSTGARRGAMMATLRCDHPDIEEFISVKHNPNTLQHFNLSVLVSDAFMQAVDEDQPWALVFPDTGMSAEQAQQYPQTQRSWSASPEPVSCRIIKTLPARQLWQRIMQSTYEFAEPGVLFIDRINQQNNLAYREQISATNPCGEIPLPPYGACNLGSLNLTCFVDQPFSTEARLDCKRLAEAAGLAVRLLDNVIDVSRYPLPQHRAQELGNRRIGLGITGLADALIMLGLDYACDAGREQAAAIMREICHAAYRSSCALAVEKGAFPNLQREAYLKAPFIQQLPEDIRAAIARQGIRNSHILAIAPTGTISLFANNISSGIEPVYDLAMQRRILEPDGHYIEHTVLDYAWHRWRQLHPDTQAPAVFQTAHSIDPLDHLRMQAALQAYVDSAISKTINVPVDYPFTGFAALYQTAYRLGVKGCTTYRPNPVTGSILSSDQTRTAHHCCSIEREAD